MDSSLPRALHDAMSTRLGDGWLTGEGRRLYGGDDSRRWAMPSAVALPRTREDVVALVRACREHRVPLVARGAGTGTTGAAVPTQGGVVVSFARMDRILELRAADRCVVVEPGVLQLPGQGVHARALDARGVKQHVELGGRKQIPLQPLGGEHGVRVLLELVHPGAKLALP